MPETRLELKVDARQVSGLEAMLKKVFSNKTVAPFNQAVGDVNKSIGKSKDQLKDLLRQLEGLQKGTQAFKAMQKEIRGVNSEIRTLAASSRSLMVQGAGGGAGGGAATTRSWIGEKYHQYRQAQATSRQVQLPLPTVAGAAAMLAGIPIAGALIGGAMQTAAGAYSSHLEYQKARMQAASAFTGPNSVWLAGRRTQTQQREAARKGVTTDNMGRVRVLGMGEPGSLEHNYAVLAARSMARRGIPQDQWQDRLNADRAGVSYADPGFLLNTNLTAAAIGASAVGVDLGKIPSAGGLFKSAIDSLRVQPGRVPGSLPSVAKTKSYMDKFDRATGAARGIFNADTGEFERGELAPNGSFNPDTGKFETFEKQLLKRMRPSRSNKVFGADGVWAVPQPDMITTIDTKTHEQYGEMFGLSGTESVSQAAAFGRAAGRPASAREFGTSLALTQLHGLSGESQGSFLYGASKTGNKGGMQDVADLIGQAVSAHLGNSDIQKVLEEQSSWLESMYRTGHDVSLGGIRQGAADLMASGVDPLRAMRLSTSFGEGVAKMARNGPQNGADVRMMRLAGWEPEQGFEGYAKARLDLQDPGFAASLMIDDLKGYMVGGNDPDTQDTRALILQQRLDYSGAKVSGKDARAMAYGLSQGTLGQADLEDMIRQGRAGATALGGDVIEQAGIDNKLRKAGEGAADYMQDFQESMVNLSIAFNTNLGPAVNTFAEVLQKATSVLSGRDAELYDVATMR